MSVTLAKASSQSLSTTNTLGIDGGAITMMCWMKQANETTGSPEQGQLYQGNATSDVGYFINYNYNAGTRRIEYWRVRHGVAIDQVTYNVTLGTTNWNHLALTYDNTNVRGYFNGVLQGTTASSGSGTGGGGNGFQVGMQNSTEYADSSIGEVRVWNVALSESEVLDEMRSKVPCHQLANLKVWLPLDNASLPASYIDMSGNGVNMTINNTPTVGQSPPF